MTVVPPPPGRLAVPLRLPHVAAGMNETARTGSPALARTAAGAADGAIEPAEAGRQSAQGAIPSRTILI